MVERGQWTAKDNNVIYYIIINPFYKQQSLQKLVIGRSFQLWYTMEPQSKVVIVLCSDFKHKIEERIFHFDRGER